jgi:flagellar hook-basal body complex protein FliE
MAIPAIPSIGVSGLGPDLTGATQDVSSSASPQGGKGFGGMLGDALSKLGEADAQASQQAQLLATGKSQDLTTVVMAVERAGMAFQLATQVRNKAVEAYQDIMRTQV